MSESDDWAREDRAAMVLAIEEEVIETASWLGKGRLDPAVMAAMAKVPRHLFVPEQSRTFAYENRPLSIGQGQTISQPYIVAVMSDLAGLGPGDKVLEVGTGCGYQAAVLAELAEQVYSIETVPELTASAAERLRRLGYDKVQVREGDGSLGWPEEAPYDAILVTAAAFKRVPPALLEQLVPGGRLITPLQRSRWGLEWAWRAEQELLLITKDQEGKITEKTVLPVAFVPLIEGRILSGPH